MKKNVLVAAMCLVGGAAFAQTIPMAPYNLVVDGGSTIPNPPPTGSWPQPPMPGMPVVNAPVNHQIATGANTLRLGTGPAGHAADVGAFRISCPTSHANFDDPLVYPGNVGRAHHHTFFGNTAVTGTTNLENLRNIGASTCRGGNANKSAYWVPTMVAPNGTPIYPYSIQVYYKAGYNQIPRSEIQRMPDRLRMIAGFPMQATAPQNPVHSYHCHYDNTAGGPENRGLAVPQCPYRSNPDSRWFAAGSTVWAILDFPNCWNGRDLDSADHKSHMAYSGGGRCPSSHPVAIPQITYNVLYAVPEGVDTSTWRLSSDMGSGRGYSFHGDWVNGWDPAIVDVWLNNCVRASRDCQTNLLGDGRSLE